MYQKIKCSKPIEMKVNDREFHSALQLLIQFLYIIRDMASSDTELNQKNAKILQANIFHHDMCIISQYALKLYDPKKHNASFLHDTIEFTHIMLEMLDEYSKGKVLTIQTQKKRKIKRKQKKTVAKRKPVAEGEIEEFAEELDFSDNEFEEELEDEENIERSFNFVSELSVLVDYDVIQKYTSVLRNVEQYKKHPILLKACTVFFRRIHSQTKQTWIFFQLETLSIFNDFLQKDVTNNSLMKGIQDKVSHTQNDKMVDAYSSEMKAVITMVVQKFTELMKKNKMLGVEILFRFPSREVKDMILNNYDSSRP